LRERSYGLRQGLAKRWSTSQDLDRGSLMKIKKWSILLGVFLLGLVVVHQWTVYRVKNMVRDTLRKDSGYPARISSFKGFLPTGSFWGKGIEFKTALGRDSIDWNVPSLRLRLLPGPFFRGRYCIQNLETENVAWVFNLRDLRGKMEGDLKVRATSKESPPRNLPKEALWCERLVLSVDRPSGVVRETQLDLFRDASLQLEPFSLYDGAPVLPFDFALKAVLGQGEGSPNLHVTGRQDQSQNRIDADIWCDSIGLPAIEWGLQAASVLDPTLRELKGRAREWIEGGSFAIRLRAVVAQKKTLGELTLRLSHPRFGETLKVQELAGQTLRTFLEAFERREDTIQLGPIPFEEDLATPREEGWEQIQKGLVAALVSQAPGAALETGAGVLRKFLGKD